MNGDQCWFKRFHAVFELSLFLSFSRRSRFLGLSRGILAELKCSRARTRRRDVSTRRCSARSIDRDENEVYIRARVTVTDDIKCTIYTQSLPHFLVFRVARLQRDDPRPLDLESPREIIVSKVVTDCRRRERTHARTFDALPRALPAWTEGAGTVGAACVEFREKVERSSSSNSNSGGRAARESLPTR